MEKIRREVKLFWTRNGKSLFQVLGFIAVVILIVQGLNQLAKLQNEDESFSITNEQIEKENNKKKKEDEDKNVILTFISYCNNAEIMKAYEMLSADCKKNKYSTIEEFQKKYINKVFKSKKDCEIVVEYENVYKIIFLKDLLQAGTIENRKELEDYYCIVEDVLGNKTININLYNNI